MRTNSHGNRQHSRHGNGNTTDEQDEQVIDASSVSTTLNGPLDHNLNDDADKDAADAEGADGSQNLQCRQKSL